VPGFDKELNLIYLPTGNGPPDYWGGDRNAAKENTVFRGGGGRQHRRTKWVFQTVHHDIWDYDLPSQPVLFHMKNDRAKRFRS
jgi:quinate dehydrogenase (quinone)